MKIGEYMNKRKRLKLKKGNLLFIIGVILISLIICQFLPKNEEEKEILKMENWIGKSLEEIRSYAAFNDLVLIIEEEYSSEFENGVVISQNVSEGEILEKNQSITLIVSKGEIPIEKYREMNVNELGEVPILMYHKIVNMKSSDTSYTGGNVDSDGYNRTTEAFRKDLEFYYNSGYRMIRLVDYVLGKIDTPFGMSPLILTFDDGNEDNMKILGIDDEGKLEIDPNCAVGILEEFKSKYPDFNVTATFFVNEDLFHQSEYNEQILLWLVENGYDIGNHTMNHPDITKISQKKTLQEVGGLYNILEKIIPSKYVSIVALPYGSPYKLSHENYEYILNGTYENFSYSTMAALRVGWKAEISPFDKDFNQLFLKRIRAYDNNGVDFDIEMNFKLLNSSRYISDGDPNIIVIPENIKSSLADDLTLKVITYPN